MGIEDHVPSTVSIDVAIGVGMEALGVVVASPLGDEQAHRRAPTVNIARAIATRPPGCDGFRRYTAVRFMATGRRL
jgi:hypothetical protein